MGEFLRASERARAETRLKRDDDIRHPATRVNNTRARAVLLIERVNKNKTKKGLSEVFKASCFFRFLFLSISEEDVAEGFVVVYSNFLSSRAPASPNEPASELGYLTLRDKNSVNIT